MAFGDAFNQSMERVSGLQTLSFGDAFNQSLERVTLQCARARPRQRCVLGVFNCYGSEGPSVKVLTINVTLPTRERLDAVLQQAKVDQAAVIAMQKTRHPVSGFR